MQILNFKPNFKENFFGYVRSKPLVLIGLVLLVTSSYIFATRLTPGLLNKNKGIVFNLVTLEYWGIFEPSLAIAPLIDEYNSLHPNVNIVYLERKFEDDLPRYKNSLFSRLKEGGAPSIFRIHSTWIPSYFSELSSARGDLSSLQNFKKRFYEIAEDQCVTSSGQVYCVPLMYDGLALLYNKAMFDADDIDEPATWEEVRSAAIRLTRYNGGTITRAGIALGTAGNVSNSSDILGLMFAQSGVLIPSSLDTQAAVAALTFYRNFSEKDKVWDATMQNSLISFATEKVAMVFATSWQIREILEINPTLKFIVIPSPQLPNLEGDTTTESWASFWVEAVNADISEEEQNAAWQFLDWLSQPEQQIKLFTESSKYKIFGNVYSDKSLKDALKGNRYLNAIVEQAPYANTSFISDRSGNDVYTDVIKTAIDAGGDPLASLKTAKTKLLK